MEPLIEALGINWKSLLAYGVNFIVLMFILKKIGYKPLLAFIEERTQKIADGLKNAELAKANLAEANTQHEQILLQARQEAGQIIEQAKANAQQQFDKVVQHSKTESGKIVQAAKLQITQERAEALQSAKSEVANLVIQASEKLLRKKMDPTTDTTFIDTTLNELHV